MPGAAWIFISGNMNEHQAVSLLLSFADKPSLFRRLRSFMLERVPFCFCLFVCIGARSLFLSLQKFCSNVKLSPF